MDLIPFLNLSFFLELLILIIVFFVVFSFFLILFLISSEIKRKQELAKFLKTFRVYKINVSTGAVVYFDHGDSHFVHQTSLNEFLMQYGFEDLDRVQQWFNDLMARDDTPRILETAGTQKFKGQNLFTLLEITKIDKEKRVIHLNSHLMSILKPKHKKRNQYRQAMPLDLMVDQVKKTSKKLGILYYIRFAFTTKIDEENQKLSGLYLIQIKDRLRIFLSPSLRLIDSEYDLIFFHFEPQHSIQKNKMIRTIVDSIDKYLEINSLKDDLVYSLSMIEHQEAPQDLNTLIKFGAQRAQSLINRKQKTVSLSISGQPSSTLQEANLDLDVKKIIRERALTFKYRAILDTEQFQVFGFFSMIQPESDKNINSLTLQKYVASQSNSRETMNYMVKTVLDQTAKITSDNQKLKIFVPLSVYQKNYLTQYLASQINFDSKNLVIVFEESEIRDAESTKGISTLIESIHQLHLEVALVFGNANLLFNNEIYELFDYYLFDQRLTLGVEEDQRKLLSIRTIIDRLSPLKKPFIGSDMNELTSLELLDNLGVKLQSAELIAPMTIRFEMPDKKIIQRLKQFKEKLKGR
jgi:EAL domain-containing protein (putative c-di-GMP-specific phosphodiesterase class I)